MRTARVLPWASSLFEDAAEYGYGMLLATKSRRKTLAAKMEKSPLHKASPMTSKRPWKAGWQAKTTLRNPKNLATELKGLLKDSATGLLKEIHDEQELFVKKSHWVFGGDGWGYDIGFGGVDHVLASGDDINILVLDTEVYSNTGGPVFQGHTHRGAIAKYAASGKKIGKKDMARMMMSYGYIYVASISMGASKNQTLKALLEAEEAIPGPSLVIAYAPCINQGHQKRHGKIPGRRETGC